MTRAIRVFPDGTRMYKGGARYKPVAPEDRKVQVHKPEDPRAVRFHTKWFLPLEVVADDLRVMPETKPDDIAYDHMSVNIMCRCEPCMRPEAERWRRKYRREQ